MTPPPREWDAASYDRLAAPMTSRGVELLDRLELRGDETVVDAGCGTGQVTAALLERLPGGRVLALDASQAMLDGAARRFAGDPRVELVRADLERELPVDGPVDAIVSTSTLHWVHGHGALFARFAAVLAPGGMLLAEYGGAGNIASVLAVLHALGHDEHPWTFAEPAEELEHLRAAGFAEAHADLVPRPAPIPPEELEHYLATVVLGWHADRLGPERGPELVREVAAALPEPVMDYVRLIVAARR
jgi:trans-aconitate 2-methyltransferase